MVRVPGSLGDAGFHRESQDDAHSARRNSTGGSEADRDDPDLEEKPLPPPQVLPRNPAGRAAKHDPSDEHPAAKAVGSSAKNPAQNQGAMSKKKTRAARKKLRAPDAEPEDRSMTKAMWKPGALVDPSDDYASHWILAPCLTAHHPRRLSRRARPCVAPIHPRRGPSFVPWRLLPPGPGAPTSSAGLLRGTPSFMARRHDVDANDIDLEEEELDTDDLEAAGCAVCALGAHRLRLPVAPQVQLPASGAPVHSVTALVADAHTLQRENQELRAQYELVSAHHAGLATHASVLHDRNLAILHRAREGFRAGMIRLEQALLSREHAERDYAVLEDRVADFRARAERADAAKALLRAERGSSTEQYRDLQAQLRAAQDQVTDLTAQLARAPATPPPSTRDDARAERDDLRVDLAAAQAALAPIQARVAAAEAERDQIRQLVATAEQQRDAALAERDRVARVLMVVEQECDGALDMRDQVRRASTALRRERDAAVAERDQARQAVATLEQRRDVAVAERDQARQALTALEQQRAPNDLRRVNALLVAHAEELRRGATRIHELEESVATATTLRVAAESDMAQAQAGELCATSRAAQYRAGWLSMRRSYQQHRGTVGAQTHRLSARVAELEEERDMAIRERDERAVAWRRILRGARRGRELARRVRDELADRLAGVVTRVGGQIDTADLVRRLEATFTAEIDVPAASAVPVPASTISSSGARAGSSASTADSTTGPSPPAGPSGSRPVPTSSAASSSSGFRRPRHGASSRSGSQSRASRPSGAASATSSGSSPLRRSRRPFTVADTAASDNAAAQAYTPSVAAAAAARAREDASLFGSGSSDSEDQARRAQSKCRRLRSPGSRSPSLASTRSAAFGALAGAGPGPGPGDSGDSSGDDSSASSSSRASSSSTTSSGSAGSAPAAPFFI
ncbi:hypothetical protein PHYSODRAFT_333290 [Phytophthora sojae]|uniref:Uncharacterized protein n=1 Tax=Phytophthora sojae (strain P6497) TaxID=1094619 RepID=G4ZMG4_PHYSP|nr:hypothetical protein PHYSODRAFT_333290 [Phytophthora sojae]EGZ15017.1 hypothetical protein PHYSODRAFT_333290 [Phytophthora sojae]|eukprot:XP_009528766.1 hypothetical protein PHYSODRAFT_333290 [Phytophthora sojae]